jgi:hypothetical protein
MLALDLQYSSEQARWSTPCYLISDTMYHLQSMSGVCSSGSVSIEHVQGGMMLGPR